MIGWSVITCRSGWPGSDDLGGLHAAPGGAAASGENRHRSFPFARFPAQAPWSRSRKFNRRLRCRLVVHDVATAASCAPLRVRCL